MTQRLLARGFSARPAGTGARSRLTMLHREGDVGSAAHVAGILVDNAVRYVEPVRPAHAPPPVLRLAVTQGGGLLIDVADCQSAYKDFDAAVTGELGERGLWQARTEHGARLEWFLLDRAAAGKTVRTRIGGTT